MDACLTALKINQVSRWMTRLNYCLKITSCFCSILNFFCILGEFSINNITGEISTNALLDREAKSHFELKVIAEDGDPVTPRSNNTVVDITIVDQNDNSPNFTKTRKTVHVLEDVSVGFSVANVSK